MAKPGKALSLPVRREAAEEAMGISRLPAGETDWHLRPQRPDYAGAVAIPGSS